MARTSNKPAPDGYVRAWKLMQADEWAKLPEEGTLVGRDFPHNSRFDHTIYGVIIGFFTRQIANRTSGSGTHWPWTYDFSKPDLRVMRAHFDNGPLVRIELFVPVDQAMIHLHFPWNNVMMSYHRSIMDETDENEPALRAWHDELVANGVGPQPDTFGYPYPEPYQSRLEAGWERIFDFDMSTTDPRDLSVSFERLDMANVVSVQEFAEWGPGWNGAGNSLS